MDNLIWLGFSGLFVVAVLAGALLIERLSGGSSEYSRKFVHILVGNWVFFLPKFTALWAAMLLPVSFIVVNYLSHKHKLISAMERDDDSMGTVFYAVSLSILVFLGFVTGWLSIPFIGMLTMSYGDGLAAIVGQRWGRPITAGWMKGRSMAGSATVFVVSLVITATALTAFALVQGAGDRGTLIIMSIAIATALLATFAESIGIKGSDNLTLPIATGIFATLSYQFFSWIYMGYMAAALCILLYAYAKQAITEDGILAAIVTAAMLYTLGGAGIALSLLVFFIAGSAISKVKNAAKVDAERIQKPGSRRNWKQVLCNTLPVVAALWAALILPHTARAMRFASYAVFAAAASDTFSSELGMFSGGPCRSILTGKPVPHGLSGGVSAAGFAAGALGSLMLAAFGLFDFNLPTALMIFCFGFLGTIIDSGLGALLQAKYADEQDTLLDAPIHGNERLTGGCRWATNNAVNLMTLSIIAVLAALSFSIALG